MVCIPFLILKIELAGKKKKDFYNNLLFGVKEKNNELMTI